MIWIVHPANWNPLIFWNPLMSHLLSNVINLGFLFIFNYSSVNTVLGKMTKFYTNKTSFCSIPFPHVILHTINFNVSKLSIVMTSTLGVLFPTKYSFYNLFYWVQYLSFAFRRFVPMLLLFVTFSFKFRFLFAFISSMTMLITSVTFYIEFSFTITLHCFMYNLIYKNVCK